MPDEQSSNTPERQQDTGYDSSEDWTAKWSNVFRLATGRMTDEGTLQWKKDRDDKNEEADCAKCEKNRDYLLQYKMVHAYDHLRFQVQWEDNLRHAACSEIRASTLSGECRWTREFWTKNQWKFTQQLQECVRRRATLSVAGRPYCKDDVQAAKVVNEVWDSCFSDTRPFDEVYR
ncbi:MAG: hypothetical protein LQ350_005013 [Teloschistes chrysophthalmus]|nr:MAG: hypothetical protein LQ350_005013 [Niorma chrysophthalma]